MSRQEPIPATRPSRRRARRSAAALAAVVLATLGSVLPASVAGAAGTRTVNVTITCTSTSLTIGTPTNCTIKVDDNASGTKSAPAGTVALSVSSPSNLVGSIAFLGTCVLAPTSSRASECVVPILPLGSGSPVLRAEFTPTDADPHQAGSRTRNLTVASLSNPVAYAPVFDATRSGSGTAGGDVSLYLAGCNAGGAAQFSVFVSPSGDPSSASDRTRPWSQTVDAWGAANLAATLASNHPTGIFRARFTCSDGAPSTPTSDNVDWTSPQYTFTVSAASQAGARLVAVRAEGPDVTVPASATWSVDPESAPLVDRVGIHGAQALLLKRQVDDIRAVSGTVGRLAQAALGRMPTRAQFDRWIPAVQTRGTWGLERELERTPEFVGWFALASDDVFLDRAYARTLGRWPTTAERSAARIRLASQGVPRVRILAELAESPAHRARVAVRDDVVAAYLGVTTTVPSPADLVRFEAMSRAVVLRIQVIEEIALTRATAQRWMDALAVPGARPRF